MAFEVGQQQRGRKGGQRRGRGKGGEKEENPYVEKIVKINRVAKVVKGGRRFSFSVYGVVGDGAGRVGIGLGKANLVPDAIRKSLDRAKQSMFDVPITKKGTIPYKVEGRFGAGRVLLKPAAPGTGIIAGGPVRAVLEAVGVTDILSKCIGTHNPSNVLRATVEGLRQLCTAGKMAKLRGLSVNEIYYGAGITEVPEAQGQNATSEQATEAVPVKEEAENG